MGDEPFNAYGFCDECGCQEHLEGAGVGAMFCKQCSSPKTVAAQPLPEVRTPAWAIRPGGFARGGVVCRVGDDSVFFGWFGIAALLAVPLAILAGWLSNR